jgi:uncharacterized protein
MTLPGRIIIPGGSGFLGRTLAKYFASRGSEVVVLSRQAGSTDHARVVEWDGARLGPWTGELEGAAAVINLAGRSVNCRYNPENRREMMDSRVQSTRVLGRAIYECSAPPEVWLNSSTATIYRHTYGEAHGEDGETGATPEANDGFSIEVARAWEDEFERANAPMTRKAALRTAIVFGNEPGGVYEILRRLARLGLGGRNGDGRQYVSWIHAEDFCRAIEWLIGNERAEGIYNLAAPGPLPNAEAMAAIRRAVGMPIGLPATRWMLEIGAVFLRTETELILKSRRVVPKRLTAEGFEFKFAEFAAAVADLERAGG